MSVDNASWDQLKDHYAVSIFDSLTSKRIPVLRRIQALLAANDIPAEEIDQVSLKLLKTFNYYQDVNSRNELLLTLEAFISHDAKYLSGFSKFVHLQVQKPTMAVTDYLVLLQWINRFSVLAANQSSDELTDIIVKSQAILLHKCIDITQQEHKDTQHRRRVFDSALTSTRASILNTLKQKNDDTHYLELASTLLKSTLPHDAILSYFGALNTALNDLIEKPALLETFKTAYVPLVLEFYSNQVLLNKTTPSVPSLTVFGGFVNQYVDSKALNELLPNIDKCILRSSENSFGVLLPPLFKHISTDVQLDDLLVNSKLLTSILSGFKSAKENVRVGAFNTLAALVPKNFKTPEVDNTYKLIDEIFKTLKATSNVDAKYIIINSLTLLTVEQLDVSTKIITNLLPLVSKDQNETTLSSLIRAFVIHSFKVLENQSWEPAKDLLDKVIAQFKTGLSDKKLPLRKLWFVGLGEYIYNSKSTNDRYTSFLEDIQPLLLETLEAAQQAPIPTITNKGIASAYVSIALAKNTETPFVSSLTNSGDRPSLLTNAKVYSKLTHDDEIKWAVRALFASVSYVNGLDEEYQLNYAVAWVYFIASKNVPYDIRLYAIKLIKEILKEHELRFVEAIFKVLRDYDLQVDHDIYAFDLKNLSPLVSALTQVPSNVDNNFLQLIAVANHSLVPIKNGWVGLAQRSGHNLDVGSLVKSRHSEIIKYLYELLETSSTDDLLFKASIKALGILAFIQPNIVSPILTETINSIDVDEISSFDSQAISIWRAEEGELVVDVLNQNTKKTEDKNSKDYEIKKWEESIKKELTSKKGSTKKLNKEEHTLVKLQLEKESTLRHQIQSVIKKVNSTLALVTELTDSALLVDNGTHHWFHVAVQKLFALAQVSSVPDIFGEGPVQTYLDLSKLLSPRLGATRKYIGVNTLRLYKATTLPQNYLEAPLLKQISSFLYSTHSLSEKAPLDSLSLPYILPLLTKVLENGKEVAIKNASKQAVTSEFVDEDPEAENLLLAVQIIAAHSEAFEDESIPRVNILKVLISLMQLPSEAKLAKECFLSLCQHIAVSITSSDLKVLFDNVITPNVFVRTAILEGIDSEFDLSGELSFSSELWVAVHDNDRNSAEIAATIWDDNDLQVAGDAPSQLLKLANNKDSGLRLSVAKAIVSAVKNLKESDPSIFDKTLQELIDLYHIKKNPPPAALDKFGLVIKSATDQRDTWEERSTIALILKLFAPIYDNDSLEKVFKFLVDEGALGDKDDVVRQELQDAGIAILNLHGSGNVETLIPIFEANLAEKDKGSKVQDNIKECVIILYGALARHLDPRDARLEIIVERLIKTLDTPSEDVQFAVSEGIAPLVPYFNNKLQEYFDTLFEKLFEHKKFAVRRGAAYGISGLVKGAGIKSLSSFDIIRSLTDASDDKKNPTRREGVSFAFECLSLSLGKFFEPYVIEVLPIILKSLGDAVPEVREATDSAAKQIMKNTTSFGVKKLIPLAISNLDEIQWRSKKGSVELLGSMAYLDPAQLSASLSTIVPEIVGVLNDTHKEVRKAADQALKRFGEVIRNPEIQSIVPDLLNAIGDPTKYTDDALDKLIKTQFVHYIDGPSLALIIHVIHRGMRDRSAGTKKKACQIVGNMAILVDSKDLGPYLSQLVSELEVAMVDPVPATRSTAARALGSLVEKLGEEQFPDLIPRLLGTLQDEGRAGDRLGSAQALSEVICGLGINKLEDLLPTILSSASSTRNHIRAGFMPLLLFLPVCFGSQFAPYLSRIIPPILNGLADVDEDIRDTALRAGRLIVKNFANKAVDLLLPELELGLSDPSYRIRLSSLELTGDLLFQITGVSGKNELTEDLAEFTGEVNKNLFEVLGQERRDRVLASLFLCRSDVTGIVRSAAVDIWKALVANTPRTVKEILPSLTSIIIRRLASIDDTQRTIAAHTLGEMVRLVGANALAQLLPTLEESLNSNDYGAKQGICIALNELIKSSQEDALIEYQEVFIRIIRETLVDSDSGVREASAQAFESLQEQLGKVVIDEILPHLLNMLESDDSENALLALQDIMATKADVIFPILIPTLLSPPIDSFKAKALSTLASVAGSALYRRLSLIINTLINAVIDSKSDLEEAQEEIISAFDNILLAIDDDEGVHPLMQQLLSLVKHEDAQKRAVIYGRLGNFFAHTTLDYSVYLQDVVSQFILSLGDTSSEVVNGTFEALTALIKRQPKESLERLVKPAYQALSITGVSGQDLAAFKLPKGPNCILPVFLHGLMYGSSEQKELSALAIADIIDKTPSLNLKPFATTITGPLIRVIGEKVSSNIKAAILIALNNLLLKIAQFLRPFIPQLQRTFVRSLSDSSNEKLRARAVTALGTLIEFQPRVDSLVTELVTGAKNSDDQGVKTSMLKAMLQVVDKAGKNMNESSKTSIMTLVEEEITVVDDKSAVSYARLVGSLSRILSTEEAAVIIRAKILDKENNSNDKFCVLSINSFLRYSPAHVFQAGLLDEIVDFVIQCSNSTSVYISDNATVAIGKLLLLINETKSPVQEGTSSSPFELGEENISKLATQVAATALRPVSNSPDTRRLSLVVIRIVARFKSTEAIAPHLDVIVPNIFACIRDPIIPVKLAAEKAYISVFDLVDDVAQTKFNQWFTGKDSFTTVTGTSIVARSIGDYTKRVASRLAGVERERIEAGGDEETMFSDRFEDETEVWAVGGVDLA